MKTEAELDGFVRGRREKIAAMAMQAIVTSRPAYCEDYEEVARDAVKYADALIKELDNHV